MTGSEFSYLLLCVRFFSVLENVTLMWLNIGQFEKGCNYAN